MNPEPLTLNATFDYKLYILHPKLEILNPKLLEL
jgi:hypothetical protein